MTFIENEIARSEKMLARWRGKPAIMRGPHEIQIRCVDVVVSDGQPGKNLLVALVDPQLVSGPREWSNSHIVLRPFMLENGEEGIELLDEANGVRLLGATFEVKENVKLKSAR